MAIYSGTFINNPFLTLVPIIIASYAIGAFVLGRPLRIPAEGIELLKNPHLLTGGLLSQAISGKLANSLAFHNRRHGAFGGLFAYCLSSNIMAVASASSKKGCIESNSTAFVCQRIVRSTLGQVPHLTGSAMRSRICHELWHRFSPGGASLISPEHIYRNSQ